MPLSEDEVSLGDDEFVVPEDPIEHERFKRRLIATTKSLKKKQQQVQADQDPLTDRWTEVLVAEEYGLDRPTKSYLKRKLLPNSMMRRWSQHYQCIMRLTDQRVAEIKWQFSPNTSRHCLAEQIETQQLGDTHMTCGTTWRTEQARLDRYMDRGGASQYTTTATTPNITNTNLSGPNTIDQLSPSCVAT